MTRLLLVGNPNAGKTTLFNALTGERQRVGNWAGVTVEKIQGHFSVAGHSIELTDLPGLYSLSCTEYASLDEKIASDVIVEDQHDLIINVIDACHLERHLYLTSQLLELGRPMVIVLTMLKQAAAIGLSIDQDALAQRIGCPVFAFDPQGDSKTLKAMLVKPHPVPQSILEISLPFLKEALFTLEQSMSPPSSFKRPVSYFIYRFLEGDARYRALFSDDALHRVSLSSPLELDIVLADIRYQAIHAITSHVLTSSKAEKELKTMQIDKIVLHRFWGLPIFFGLLYLVFFIAIEVGGRFQAFFDLTSEALFVTAPSLFLQKLNAPTMLTALIADGLGRGINTTLTFIPVIAFMNFFLNLLESSGYMARAAFVMDRLMRALSLPGKAFVPMIIGFGCNVPAIMATRTLETPRDRWVTLLMTPFMSCSARLAIFAVFVAAFFPQQGALIVFSLYLFGIAMAILMGFLLRKSYFSETVTPLVMELPLYHTPKLSVLLKETMQRVYSFIIRAAKVIIPTAIVLGALNGGSASVLMRIGHFISPFFAPMGISVDNWPATIALITGILAKEVVISTLNTLYGAQASLSAVAQNGDVLNLLKEACQTLWSGVSALDTTPPEIYAALTLHFKTGAAAYAYLIFILLYIPCVSTIAAIRQETNRYWMIFSAVSALILAYSFAVIFYQLATFASHPLQSSCWILGFGGGLWLAVRQVNTHLNRGQPYALSAA